MDAMDAVDAMDAMDAGAQRRPRTGDSRVGAMDACGGVNKKFLPA